MSSFTNNNQYSRRGLTPELIEQMAKGKGDTNLDPDLFHDLAPAPAPAPAPTIQKSTPYTPPFGHCGLPLPFQFPNFANLAHTQDKSHYPIYAFPEVLKNAILEVFYETKAPIPLIAASALSALSMACQHIFDAGRPNGMHSPCSLFFVTIAESGERKTSSDRFFTKKIREFESKQNKDYATKFSEYEINLEIWESEKIGIKRKIQKLAGKDNKDIKNQLREHEKSAPEKPLNMRMLFDDVSPTAIISSLHNDWPSVGILSDEAGKIFNSKTFENIGLFNKLWDGDEITLDRYRKSSSYTASNSRITISLMSQRKTFIDFLKKQGNLARDNGFFARCLVCLPVSTQGSRTDFRHLYPNSTKIQKPNLEFFHTAIDRLLISSFRLGRNVSEKKLVKMSIEAEQAWHEISGDIESQLGLSGILQDVKDSASKISENIARMACLFQVFEALSSKEAYEISKRNLLAASHICLWYLRQFQIIFGEYSPLSEDAQNANKILVWARTKNTLNPIKKNEILQQGPYSLRKKETLDRALEYMLKHELISIHQSQEKPGVKPTTSIAFTNLCMNQYFGLGLP